MSKNVKIAKNVKAAKMTIKVVKPVAKNIPAVGKTTHGFCGKCKTGVDFKVKEIRKTTRVRACGVCPKCHKGIGRGF